MTPLIDITAKAMMRGWAPNADWDQVGEAVRRNWRQRARLVLDDVYEHMRRLDAKAIEAGKATALEHECECSRVDVVDVELAWPAMLAVAFGKVPAA